MSIHKQLNKRHRRTCRPDITVSYTDVFLLVMTVHCICRAEQEEQDQGLLGERVVNTPEASSMVFLRAVSLATLWLSRLRRSCGKNILFLNVISW